MGWKHQAVFPSGKSYGPTLTQHLKVPKVYPARGGQRFAVVCPAVLTLNETCTCAPSPRDVDQVGAGCRIQHEILYLSILNCDICSTEGIHLLHPHHLWTRWPSFKMDLEYDFSQHGIHTSDHLWWHFVSQQLGHYPILLSLNSLQVPVHSQWRWGDVHPVQRRNHWPLASTAWQMERPAILSGMSGKFNKNDGIGWTNVSNKKRQYGFRPSNQWKWLVGCYSSCAHRWRHRRAPVAHVSEGWTIWFSRTKHVVLDGVGMFQRQNPGMLLVITQHVLVLV